MRNNDLALSKRTAVNSAPWLCLGLLASVALTGCGMSSSTGTGAASGSSASGSAGAHFQGKVYGGQNPVSNSTIQLYTVSTSVNSGTGAPNASTTMLTASVVTDAGGNFNITGDYNCNASSATQVYITATGGNSGTGSNSAISLMTALGPCTSLSASTFIQINELTTVAAAFSLAQFATDFQHIGAAGTNPTGLVNAFTTARMMVNNATGTISTVPTGITLPVSRLDTLADILAACVNTASNTSSNCNTLLGATGATETIGAALAIAKAPGTAAYTALFSLGTSSPPFVPVLSAQPNDFSIAINYTGTELASPYGIALDAAGNAWVTNEAGRSVVKAPNLSGTFATTTYSVGGLLAPRGISIDRTGNVWVANTGGNTVVELNSTGGVLSGAGFTAGGISAPVAIANDSAGNAWVANFNGNSITELGTTGTASGASPITGSSALSSPSSIAIGPAGRVLVGNSGTGQLCIFSNAAALQSCVSDGTLFGSTALAVSSTGNISMAGSTTGSAVAGAFTLATTTGTVVTNSPGVGGGLVLPTAVAYAGTGKAWFANSTSISQFTGLTAVSPSTGFGTLNAPAGIAVDASGNVWTANSGDNSLSVFVGIAAPVATPIAVNVGP